MPSSITLTVSHLPSSTSFFLSALQPLDYDFRARAANTIGFGSQSSPNAPADFWITQEIPGVPAGAAHVAFNAPNPNAVQSFFLAALKAGGKIHGEPAVRDNSGYYSAAVIDFDGNSIEAVYRPTFSDDKENDVRRHVSSKMSLVKSKAPSTVARSTTSAARSSGASQVCNSAPVTRKNSGDILDNILDQARTAANLARQAVSNTRSSAPDATRASEQSANSGSGDAVVGTLLGVAAGAALHYAFSNRNSNSNERRPSLSGRSATEPGPRSSHEYQHQQPRYHAIEAPPADCRYSRRPITMEDNDYASTVRPASTQSRARQSSSGANATPFGANGQSMASRSSEQTQMRMIEDSKRSSPPTSYKAPAAITSAEMIPASKTKPSRRSCSSSHSQSSRHSDRSGSEKTVVRVTETFSTITRTSTHPTSTDRSSKVSVSTVKPGSKAPTAVLRDREAEDHPLPPSRASTWTGSFHDSRSHASEKSKNDSSKHGSGSKSRSKTGGSEGCRTSLSKSVVGKIRDVQRLDVTRKEVRPEDSVSQVSTRA